MARLSDREFWKEQFETAGNWSVSWFQSAFDLLTAADVLDRFSGDVRSEICEGARRGNASPAGMSRFQFERLQVIKVGFMLRAMATECLLKALWLKNGEKLTKDGRYVGTMRKSEHQLHELAKAVARKGQITFADRELQLLEQASYWIITGRYPIQRDFSSLVPYRRGDGSLAAKQSWSGDLVSELTALISKLQRALGIEMRFEGSDSPSR